VSNGHGLNVAAPHRGASQFENRNGRRQFLAVTAKRHEEVVFVAAAPRPGIQIKEKRRRSDRVDE